MVSIEEIIEKAENTSWCPHCGEEMAHYSHLCDGCNERVSQPDDVPSKFIEWIRVRLSE
jgi:hypothetical protein